MLLRNWINSCSGSLAGASTTNRWKDTQGRITMYGMFGNDSNTYTQDVNLNKYTETDYGSTSGGYNPQYMRITLGTSNTTPTIDDYKMGNALINVLTSVNVSTPNANSGQTFETYSKLVWSQTVTNDTANPVTVNEVGLFGCLYNATTQNKPCVLYTRDVIDPVTIGVGETKTFVVVIDLAQMSTSASAS